jgi:hypothetical protein
MGNTACGHSVRLCSALLCWLVGRQQPEQAAGCEGIKQRTQRTLVVGVYYQALCTVHCALCAVYCALCTVYCTLCTVGYALCTTTSQSVPPTPPPPSTETTSTETPALSSVVAPLPAPYPRCRNAQGASRYASAPP